MARVVYLERDPHAAYPQPTDPHLEFSTGRRLIVCIGMISLDVEGDDFSVGGGCDEGLDSTLEDFTSDERRELADFMIDRWTAYKERQR
jgi:hypothetical protein